MSDQQVKIAIIEIGGSHDECLYSQIRFLKLRNVHLTLICDLSLQERTEAFDLVDEKYYHPVRKGGVSKWIDLIKLRNYLVKHSFDKVILNTAEGSLAKRLLKLPYPATTEFIGVLHDAEKLHSSFSQRTITRKVKKYFLLNDYLIDYLSPKVLDKLHVQSFYPIYFPEGNESEVPKNEGELWICIPGRVELQRRDYPLLMESLKKTKPAHNIRFIILGNCSKTGDGAGAGLRAKIAELGLERHFILWDNFIDVDTFHTYLKNSDYVLPLVHHSAYTHKISGAFNLAFAYKTPLLMSEEFQSYEDFKSNSVFYQGHNLIEVINTLSSISDQQYYSDGKWSFDYQQEKYWSLLDA